MTWDASNNTIGGDLAGEGNLISGNTVRGVQFGPGQSNTLKGNIVGLQADGVTPLGNGEGVSVYGDNNTIGSTASRNIISGNDTRGILVYAGGEQNTIIGNYIGTDITGRLSRGNGTNGVELLDVANNQIGGEEDSRRNLIAGNGLYGVQISGATSTDNEIVGNWIGLGANAEVIGNVGGLRIQSPQTNIRENVISGNSTFGIEFTDSDGSVIQGNFIGTDPTGTRSAGNGTFGIRGLSGGPYTIGTDGDGIEDELEGNVISANGSDAIYLSAGPGGTRSTIRGNMVGTDFSGLYALTPNVPVMPSGFYGSPVGVVVRDAEVGTNGDGISDELERNVISGGLGAGVFVYGNSIVAGNFIGVDSTGSRVIGNAGDGVVTFGESQIGGRRCRRHQSAVCQCDCR